MRIPRRLDEDAHGVGRLGLAQDDAVHATGQDLAQLPGVVAHARLVDAAHRRLDDHRWRPVARIRRPAVDEPAHVLGQAGHVEGAMLHADIDVVGPGVGILPALRIGEHVTRMLADVVDGLVLLQELDRSVDPDQGSDPSPNCHGLWGQTPRLQVCSVIERLGEGSDPMTLERGV